MVKVVNGTVVWAVPFTAPGTWRAERELSDAVAEAVEGYVLALLDAYRPQQEEFDEEALRRDVGEIVADAAQYVVDRWLEEFRRLHRERWAGRRVPA